MDVTTFYFVGIAASYLLSMLRQFGIFIGDFENELKNNEKKKLFVLVDTKSNTFGSQISKSAGRSDRYANK